MALDIDTFSNVSGGFSFFKASERPSGARRNRVRITSDGGGSFFNPFNRSASVAGSIQPPA